MSFEPKITVGICTGGTIRAETVTSLLSAIYHMGNARIPVNVLVQIGGYVDVNRNKIAEECQKNGTTHLMFIDADMLFDEDAILRLVAHDKDIVMANYNARLSPKSKDSGGATVKAFGKHGEPVSMVKLPKKLFKCYGGPTGFMMIKTKIFEKLDAPYFESIIEPDGKHWTEDIEFCRKANAAGIDVHCDPAIKIGHIGNYVY